MNKDVLQIEKLENKLCLADLWYASSIGVDKLWPNISKQDAVVAVVDSGIDLGHPEFTNSLWNNPLERVDGIDNDKNGYVDDIHGWDFVENDNSPQDGFYHGTHVSGIINSVANGSVKIMPLRFQNSSGAGYLGAAITAINYATTMKLKGINVAAINLSWVGGPSSTLSNAIARANNNGIVVVSASGNDGANNDISPRYPSAYSLSNTISVGSINRDSSWASYSNYGKNSVDVAAPGSGIYAAVPGGGYGYISGTSMATAVVSGSVGLLKNLANYSASQIKGAIVSGCDMIASVMDRVRYGIINLQKSFDLLKVQKPESSVVVPVIVVEQAKKLEWGLASISKRLVGGWAKTINSESSRPVVDVYINGKLRYSVAVGDNYGFSISINKKLMNKKYNLIEVRIKDIPNGLESMVYKNYIKR